MRRVAIIRVWPLVIAGAVLTMTPPASAWHAAGHMITVQIAYDELSDGARREVDRLVAVLADFSPRRDHAVTASLWADDLKRQGVAAFDRWHYVNRPFRDGFTGAVSPAATDNIVWAIEQAVSTLRGEAGDLAKAWMLRFLLHLVGDIHQPLHCASRFSARHPEGDRGGNDFLLTGRHEQLHAYWDHGADAFPVLDGKDWPAQVRRWTDATTRAAPKSSVPHWRQSDPETWARESFELAEAVVYRGVSEGSEPSAAYEARAQRIVHRRLALGGYRLAALLDDVFAGAPAQ